MKPLYCFSILLMIATQSSFSQTFASQKLKKNGDFLISGSLKTNSYLKYTIVRNAKEYTLYFAEHDNEREILLFHRNTLVCASIFFRTSDYTGYVATIDFSNSDRIRGEALEIISKKFIEQLAEKANERKLSKFGFFTVNSPNNNWVKLNLQNPIPESAITNTNGTARRVWQFFLCQQGYCMDSLCACIQRTLCALGRCWDENGGPTTTSCQEEKAEFRACNGDGKVILHQISMKPNTQ